MITLVQTASDSGTPSLVTQQDIFLSSLVTHQNLLVVAGFFTDTSSGTIAVTVTVTDSSGNSYLFASHPFRSGLNQDFWSQYAIVNSNASNLDVTVQYSVAVANASFAVHEFNAPFGWIDSGLTLDGFSSANTGFVSPSTPINTGPFTTTNLDDLIFALCNFSQATLTLSPGWHPGTTLHLGCNTSWIEQPSPGSVGFVATQGGGVSDLWSAAVWAFKASPDPGGGAQSFNLITSSINLTYFQESYQNRIPEDIYDSLQDQPDFVYVLYGPSVLNG